MNKADTREDGFYWVKYFEEEPWEVAKYTFGDQWECTGFSERNYDKDIFQINEKRLSSPNE
jgi:hypothetical protein